ncbi:gephyrin-like molybdotransferase Glp [candidate division KSB1 bacterium]
MISVQEALHIVESNSTVLNDIVVSIDEALGYAAAEDIISEDTIPFFDNSAMDGYAVRSEDTKDAEPGMPVVLDIVGEIPAGKPAGVSLSAGQAVKIMTGGMIPQGADAVVKVEDSSTDGEHVDIFTPCSPGLNIRYAGEDIGRGTVVISKGSLIRPADLGVLASIGRTKVTVIRKPKIAFLTTGDELIEPGENLSPGKVRNSNRFTVVGLLRDYGLNYNYLGTAGDDPKRLKKALRKGLNADVLITSGAVSVGQYDYVKDVLTELGMKTLFWRVAQRPGKPLLFGQIDRKLIFGLPGNPVSIMVTFIIYVRTAIRKMMGIGDYAHSRLKAKLTAPFSRGKELFHFSRGEYHYVPDENLFYVTPFEKQGSGILRSMSRANCLILFPDGLEDFKTGSLVEIIRLH